MTLIIVKNKSVLSMTDLMRAALMYIYMPEKMTADQIRTMKQSVVTWKEHLEYKREIHFHRSKKDPTLELSVVDQEYQHMLEDICKLLLSNEEGKLEYRKMLFKQNQIDPMKFHDMPGAHTPEDIAKANEVLKKHIQEHPEEYYSEKTLKKGKIKI